MKNILKAVAPFCAALFVASSFAQSSDETTIVGYGPELVLNGDFELGSTSFKGTSTEDKYTLAVRNCVNWYSNVLNDDDYAISNPGYVIGVGYKGAKYVYGSTTWISALDPISGNYMAFIFSRKNELEAAKAIPCGAL